MSVLEWKVLNLFCMEPCLDFNKQKVEFKSHCYNSTLKIFCNDGGWVYAFYKNWEYISFKTPFDKISLCDITADNILVLLNRTSNEIRLEAYNLKKILKHSGAPSTGSGRFVTQNAPTVLKTFSMNNQIYVAIGFEKGEILFHRAAATNRSISFNFRHLSVTNRAITGIEFKQRVPLTCTMFICADSGVFFYTISDGIDIKTVLDSKISPYRTCTLGINYFTVGCDDAVYCFNTDGRGPCYAVEGRKKMIAWFKNYLVVVMENGAIGNSHIIVIDINNKVIVLSKIMEDVACILTEKNACYILTKAQNMFLLRDRDVQSKVRILVNKNMYEFALRVLEGSERSALEIANLYMQFGDFLFNKGDFNQAVKKYIKTIGVVDPYNIIEKLLRSKCNKYLIEYLEALSKTAFWTDEHDKLLRNCNERFNLSTRVSQLCDDEDSDEIPYLSSSADLSISPIELRQFLEVKNDAQRACDLLSSLDENKVYAFFIENIHYLMLHQPKDTVAVLKLFCQNKDCDALELFAERLIPVLMPYTEYCIEFLEHLTSMGVKNKTVYNTLVEYYLRAWRSAGKQEMEILTFLESYKDFFCLSHLYVLCRNYAFCTGLIQLNQICILQKFCLQYLFKSFKIQDALTYSHRCGDFSPYIWMQVRSELEKMSGDSCNITNIFLKGTFEGNHQYVLQILEMLYKNKKLTVQEIRHSFKEDHLQKIAHSKEKLMKIQRLQKDATTLKKLLFNYRLSPIEFRSNICNICRHQLKIPTIHYLCQHSFHKECITDYTENEMTCTVCCGARRQQPANASEKISFDSNFSNIMQVVSNTVTECALASNCQYCSDPGLSMSSQVLNGESKVSMIIRPNTEPWRGRFIAADQKKEIDKESNNPFNVYDDNLNPFEDKN